MRDAILGTLTLVLLLGFPAFLIWQQGKSIDWWVARYEFANDRYEYYFDGANKRGYLDICGHKDSGEMGVWYLDDCLHPGGS